MDNTLEARGVVKRFAGHTALDGVSVEVRPGRVFGLLGPNGAGKTTLIRIINRITMPDEGEVMMGGRLMTDADVRRIGYLPEERGLYKKMKVGEQALYLAQLKGLDKATAEKRLRQWFDKFDINPWWNKKLEELSKGMQQKVQFVITVLHEPEFLIFDEPFSGFDPVNAELLKKEILELRDKGHTIIFSTHNIADMENAADYVIFMDNGKVVEQGFTEDLKDKYIALSAEPESLDKISPLLLCSSHSSSTATGLALAENKLKLEALGAVTERPTLSQLSIDLMKIAEEKRLALKKEA